ncbi:MAG: tetratricopeptide repeat protein [Tepidisphaeraceae bacterium]
MKDPSSALPSEPMSAEHWNARGCALAAARDPAGARDAFANGLKLAPKHVGLLSNFAQAAFEAADAPAAEQAFRSAISLAPRHAPAYHGLSVLLRLQFRLDEAVESARFAVQLAPSYPIAHHNLGNVYMAQGLVAQAITAYEQALSVDPRHRQSQGALLLARLYVQGDDGALMLQKHTEFAQVYAAPLAPETRPHTNAPDPTRRLRVGYVSGDLRRHPVAFFVEPLLTHHDHAMVEPFIYSDVTSPDDTTARLRALPVTWRDTRSASHSELAEIIRADGIDILVDLAGHTGDNRLLTFARRPAPVQINYVGYPSTTGLDAIDYRLSDAWNDPPDTTDAYCVEKLVRLPGGAWAFRPYDDAPPLVPSPVETLGQITFVSTNKIAKVTGAMLGLWREILLNTPTSRIIIATGGDRDGRARVLAGLQGIDPSRILLPGRMSWQEYLNLYQQSDILLDTYPHNGHTTTCDALWQGVAVVTLAGPTHCTRLGASVLSKLGLTDFIATTPPQYVRIATDLCAEARRLGELRSTMRSRIHQRGLTDGARLAREIETAYRDMWRPWCAGKQS